MARRSNNRRGGNSQGRENKHIGPPGSGIVRMSEDQLYEAIDADPNILLLVLDGVQDPHNLGACLRSADGAGVTAIIIPRHKASPVTETVVRIACGGASQVPVVGISNMARFLEKLHADHQPIRVVGTADAAEDLIYEVDLTGPLVIAMGSEEKGLRRLTMENCDHLVKIPMAGEVECLNVSSASAVCLFEAVRQRMMAEL
jgi:23S rRNA (guanosine2251-2'-O)-methyltransferase